MTYVAMMLDGTLKFPQIPQILTVEFQFFSFMGSAS